LTIVLDTNVLIAALAARQGVCARMLELCLSRHFVVCSDHILEELRRNLADKYQLKADQVEKAMVAIGSPVMRIVIPVPVPSEACRDPNDLPVLGAAKAGRAEVIVTGDKDLLVLGEYEGIIILSPRDFCNRFINPSDEPMG